MNDKNNLIKLVGWVLFLIAVGLFCVQMGYILLHDRYQVEYVDNRLFYLISILCVINLLLSLLLLLKPTKNLNIMIISIAILFIIVHIALLVNSNKSINNITSISPDFKHVFSVKENVMSGETTYYRSYYGILARPKEAISDDIGEDYKVKWLANDIVALTYQKSDQTIHQFIGTYGDRNNGMSYYNVGAEIHGSWQGDNVEVTSNPEGIEVKEKNEVMLFPWENIDQFGTLAIVLKNNNEAVWTIALNENFVIYSEVSHSTLGNISLYKATMEENEPIILSYKASN